MKILKIQQTKESFTVFYRAPAQGKGTVHAKYVGIEAPLPDFFRLWSQAQGLAGTLIETEPPDLKAHTLEFKVNKDNCLGIRFFCKVQMRENDNDWNFRTPFKYQDKTEKNKLGHLGAGEISLLNALQEETIKFVEGGIAQIDMWEENGTPNKNFEGTVDSHENAKETPAAKKSDRASAAGKTKQKETVQ